MPDPLVLRYLGHVRFEKRLAERTVTLYTLDLDKLQSLAAQAGVTLLEVGPVHMRRWVSQMHAGGRSARGIALILSGWRGFYVWLGREGLVSSNPVQGLRAPKAAKPLPKALGVDEAVQLADFKTTDSLHHPGLQRVRMMCLNLAQVQAWACGRPRWRADGLHRKFWPGAGNQAGYRPAWC